MKTVVGLLLTDGELISNLSPVPCSINISYVFVTHRMIGGAKLTVTWKWGGAASENTEPCLSQITPLIISSHVNKANKLWH